MNKKISALIAVVLVFSMLFAFAGCQSEEEETTTTITALNPLPTDITSVTDEEGNIITDTTYSPEKLEENTLENLAYFNSCLDKLLTDKSLKAAINVSQDKNITKARDDAGEEIDMSENEYINAAIKTLKNYMLNNDIDEDEASMEFGGDIAAFLPLNRALDASQVVSATCVDSAPDGDGTRTVVITLNNTELPTDVQKKYDMNFEEIKSEFQKTADYAAVDFKGEPEYKECQIIIVTNFQTDEVRSISFVKRADIAADVTGQGTLESMGKVPVLLRYEDTVKYELDWQDPSALPAEE